MRTYILDPPIADAEVATHRKAKASYGEISIKKLALEVTVVLWDSSVGYDVKIPCVSHSELGFTHRTRGRVFPVPAGLARSFSLWANMAVRSTISDLFLSRHKPILNMRKRRLGHLME